MDSTFELDTCGWPLVINRGSRAIATFPLPEGSKGDDEAGLAVLAAAQATLAKYQNPDGLRDMRPVRP